MRGFRSINLTFVTVLSMALAMATMVFGAAGSGPWQDNFDSYATGTNLHGVGGWKGWFNDPTFTAFTINAQARSAPNSIDIVSNSDVIHEFSESSGQWVFTAWQYIPGSFVGNSYFIMLNQYDDAGATLNWSVQMLFDSTSGLVIDTGASGASMPYVTNQWVEIRVEIDLIADTQTFYYNGTALYSGTWSGHVSGGGITAIGALSLFANGASSIYYDDMSLSLPEIDGESPLFVGTALNPTGTNHSAFLVDVINNTSTPVFSGQSVWGATYDFANKRYLFTGDGGTTGDVLFELPLGSGTPNALGTINDVGGGSQRIDGLAISGDVLYGSYAGATAEDGIWTIDMNTLDATLVLPLSDSISGIDADPKTGRIFGVNDTTTSLVSIDVSTGILTPVAPYPIGQTDIDGLAIDYDGRAYLVPDEPGSIYVYDFIGGSYLTPLTNPWTSADTFSGAAYAYEIPTIYVPILLRDSPINQSPTVMRPAGSVGTDASTCNQVVNTDHIPSIARDLIGSQSDAIYGARLGILCTDGGTSVAESVLITRTTVNSATLRNCGPELGEDAVEFCETSAD